MRSTMCKPRVRSIRSVRPAARAIQIPHDSQPFASAVQTAPPVQKSFVGKLEHGREHAATLPTHGCADRLVVRSSSDAAARSVTRAQSGGCPFVAEVVAI